jgi:hypothetical protein
MKHTDLRLGPGTVKKWHKRYTGKRRSAVDWLIDGLVVLMFILSCWLLYNAVVWSLWS